MKDIPSANNRPRVSPEAGPPALPGAPTVCTQLGVRVNFVYIVHMVHLVHFVYMWKSGKFTAYRYEKKGRVYFVHFSRKYFASRARLLPNHRFA